ncbi:flagellar basal-body MS-ring/collar protein FliF [Rhodopila sp.]|jgi:flagellar M-ring protein FliF|uniref:flagellar basal-body MS-ring/collar protein FliF n=1 Tax=Rhodopila sp. TaxID=2480087 RepID=UPI002D1B5E36|nr:flagellar basal-body MS-ring/collar protein FliF [Rhodopila sp.]HVZ08665.1 flagellar basal-body MS-ring/collar protein FliF [Rhodopila sp.]
MKGLLDSLRKLGLAPLLTLTGVALGMIGIVAWLSLVGGDTSRMALLYDDLDQHDASRIAEQLDHRQIPYRMEADGRRIMVPSGQVLPARAALAKEGLPVSGTIVGDEIFDRGNDLTITEFEQDVKRTRALEGELERTIQAMRGIEHARVHLVLPRKQPFERQRGEAQASVMLTLGGLRSLAPEGIQAIVNLVAGAVPGLKPQNITLVDSHLHLLAQAGDPDDLRVRSQVTEDLSRAMAQRMERAVEDMLSRSLGVGHVHAEASVRLNFEKTAETQERYDPDSSVVRSTQTVSSNAKSTERAANVSLQNNLPNADSGSQTTGNQEGRQEETTNYEISKTVQTSTRDQPRVDRITLAVMVDGVDETAADGKHGWRPRTQQELDQIARLAKTAIGFDEKRGDQVEVVSMPFINEIAPPETEIAVPGVKQRRDLIMLGEAVAIGITALAIIGLMTRSIIQGLKPPELAVVAQAGQGHPPLGDAVSMTSVSGDGASLPALAGPDGSSGGTEADMADEGTVSLTNIEGQIKASSIRKLVDLTNRYPDTALAIIREWLAAEGA